MDFVAFFMDFNPFLIEIFIKGQISLNLSQNLSNFVIFVGFQASFDYNQPFLITFNHFRVL